MATIDKLDIGVYIQYARRTQQTEETTAQYRLQEAASIPPQTHVVDFIPKPSEMDLLLGVATVTTPWAYFFAPVKFKFRRRSPFSRYRVAPTLGTLEKQDEDTAKVESFSCHSKDEEQEKKAILSCFKQVQTINEWLSYIVGRMGQFLQG